MKKAKLVRVDNSLPINKSIWLLYFRLALAVIIYQTGSINDRLVWQ